MTDIDGGHTERNGNLRPILTDSDQLHPIIRVDFRLQSPERASG